MTKQKLTKQKLTKRQKSVLDILVRASKRYDDTVCFVDYYAASLRTKKLAL